MRRIRLKSRRYIFKKKSSLIAFILTLLIVLIVLTIRFINSKVNPVLLNYGEIESRKLASMIINNAISKSIDNIKIDELFLITRENDEIKSIDFNPIVVNKVLTETTENVELNLKYMEQGKVELLDIKDSLIDYDISKLKNGIVYEIPSGVIFNYSILANIGPKIPVKLSLHGDIVSHINTKVTNYGINNALVEVNLVLELTEQVILPFTASKIKIKSSVPIALKLIQGRIPEYYINGFDSNSTALSFPT